MPKGSACRANSDIIYNLNGQYTTFISDIGLDAEVGNSGAADFQVYGDGNLLYDSGPLTGGGTPGHIVVNVAGVNSLDSARDRRRLRRPERRRRLGRRRLINGAPAAPSNLVGTIASGSQINLTWTDNSSTKMPSRFSARIRTPARSISSATVPRECHQLHRCGPAERAELFVSGAGDQHRRRFAGLEPGDDFDPVGAGRSGQSAS